MREKIHKTDWSENDNFEIWRDKNQLGIELIYPSRENDDGKPDRIKYIEVGLCDVRASDGIRIHYDFVRDGWVVEQPTQLTWKAYDKVCDEKWKEVAFVESWQLENEQHKNEEGITW